MPGSVTGEEFPRLMAILQMTYLPKTTAGQVHMALVLWYTLGGEEVQQGILRKSISLLTIKKTDLKFKITDQKQTQLLH